MYFSYVKKKKALSNFKINKMSVINLINSSPYAFMKNWILFSIQSIYWICKNFWNFWHVETLNMSFSDLLHMNLEIMQISSCNVKSNVSEHFSRALNTKDQTKLYANLHTMSLCSEERILQFQSGLRWKHEDFIKIGLQLR